MPEAMAAVKAALGNQAVIVRAGNVAIAGGTLVEIKAGIASKAGQVAAPQPFVAGWKRPSEPAAAPMRPRVAPKVVEHPLRAPSIAPPAHPEPIAVELAAIRRLLGRTLISPSAAVGLSGPLGDLLTSLIDSGMPAIQADELVGHVRDELSPSELADPATLRLAASRRIESTFTVDASPLSGRVVALVGPSGCGKTTSAAKLAALAKYRKGRSVALVSCDSARLGGTEHLALYAAAMDIPFATAVSVAETHDVLAQWADRDLIVIDTPGCGPRDSAPIAHLARLLQAASCQEVHLVLAASLSDWSTRAAVRSLAPLAPSRAIITKLDEAGGIGHVLSAASSARLGISYTCAGPNVPDNIEAASAARLARRMLEPTPEVV